MTKTLTVAVPMYRVETYIDECLTSLAIPETRDDLEVLIVNDGSPDGSRAKAARYESRWPEIFRIIDKENGGHGSAVNQGVREASGRYFKVVDGDDYVDRDGLLHLIAFLKQCDAEMVLTNYSWVNDRTGRQKQEVKEICPGLLYGVAYPLAEAAERMFLKMHAVTYRTDVLRQAKPLDEYCFYVDTEYLLYPLPFVKTVAVLPDSVYRYRIGLPGQSMNPQKMRERCGQHEKVLERLLFFYGEMTDPAARTAARELIARMAVSQYRIYLSFPDSHKAQMVALEDRLRRDFPEIYEAVRNRAVLWLRRTGYRLYGTASLAVRAMQK